MVVPSEEFGGVCGIGNIVLCEFSQDSGGAGIEVGEIEKSIQTNEIMD